MLTTTSHIPAQPTPYFQPALAFITPVPHLSRLSTPTTMPFTTGSSRPKPPVVRYKPMLAQIKKDHGPPRDARLAATLTELVFESLRIVEELNPTVNIRLENKYGTELVGGGHSIFMTKLQNWIPGNVELFLSCATELAWVLDNFNCLGDENKALRYDTMNGFFLGPRSAAELVDHLLACVCFTTKDTEAGRDSRSQLICTEAAIRFERHDRLVGHLKRARSNLHDATAVLHLLDPGLHDLQALLPRLPAPSLEKSCREALVITAAARIGITILGEEQLENVADLLDRSDGAMRATRIVCSGIVPRRLWDCLLPYVTVDKEGNTMRGTVDQADWLVTESYSGVAAGFSRLYGSRVSIDDVGAPLGVVREAHRPTVHNVEPSEMATLQWLIWSRESPLDRTYTRLREIARRGENPCSRASAREWLSLYDQVWSVDPQFAEGHFSASMSLGALSLVAAAAESATEFREGLLTRVVATFSCEDCRIETREGDHIVLGRDGEGNVTITSTGTRIGELLMEIVGRIDHHCASRGTKVKTDLPYKAIRTTVPDFVQSTSTEACTPAVWINLQDLNSSFGPPADGNP